MKFSLNLGKKAATANLSDIASKVGLTTMTVLSDWELGQVSGGLLQLDGIKGESQDDRHKTNIQISSFKS